METSSSIESDISKHSESDDPNGDGEGVWSPDIEEAFQEALKLFPPCGRRKHILSEDGGTKMYGRNELIAKHIFMRTGKLRTRKQVSSHIQVLARRLAKVTGPSASNGNGTYSTNSGCPSTSPSTLASRPQSTGQLETSKWNGYNDVWEDRPIVTPRIRLVEFSAFIERPSQDYKASSRHQIHGETERAQYLGFAHTSSMPTQVTPSSFNYNAPVQYDRSSTQLGQVSAYQQATAATSSSSFTSLLPIGSSLNQDQSVVSNLSSTIIPTNERHIDYADNRLRNFVNSSPKTSKTSRQSYVKIDYSRGLDSDSSSVHKLERIDLAQIQDKFPDISGPDGLFQRCTPGAFFLVKFWANIDLDNNLESFSMEDQNSRSEFSSRFETINPHELTCSTKACSYGSKVVEKVDRMSPVFNSSNGRYTYSIRSQMCEFMINFIKKLCQLPRLAQMNSVLENFSVLQVVSCESSSEILLCLAYVFEVITLNNQIDGGAHHRVYVLTRN